MMQITDLHNNSYYPMQNMWTLDQCIAKACKHKTLEEWMRDDMDIYVFASNMKWMGRIKAAMLRKTKINELIFSAQKYNDKRTWRLDFPKTYLDAVHLGCIHLCTSHMTDLISGLTLKDCNLIASKYTTELDWFQNDTESFKAAKRNYWVDSCNAHMEQNIYMAMKRGDYSFAECCVIASIHNTLTSWKNNHSSSHGTALDKGWLQKCKRHLQCRHNNWRDVDLEKVQANTDGLKMNFKLEAFVKKRRTQPRSAEY